MRDLTSHLLLTVASLVVTCIELVAWMAGEPDAIVAASIAGILACVFASAAWLRSHERRRDAALLSCGAILLTVPVFALRFPGVHGLVLLGPIAFVIAVPHVRRWHVVALGAACIAVTLITAVAGLFHGHPYGPDVPSFLAEIGGTSIAAAVLPVLAWRSHRTTEASNARHEQLVTNLPVGVASVSLDGHFLEVNHALARMLGYPSRRSLLDTPFASLCVDPAQADAWQATLDREGRIEVTMPLRRYDGSIVEVRARARTCRGPEGIPVSYDAAVEDITAERVAAAASARLASIVDSAGDAIFSVAVDGTILSWNVGARTIFGWPEAEVVGRTVYDLAPAAEYDRQRELLARAAAGERLGPCDVIRQHRDGASISVSLILSPIRGADGRVEALAAIARDVTEQRRLERRLERWRAEREMVVRMLYELSPGETPERTAAAVCDRIAAAGFEFSAVLECGTDTSCSFLAFHGPSRRPTLERLAARASELRERARGGAWVEAVTAGPVGSGPVRDAGIRGVACVPIMHDGEPLAVLAVTGLGMGEDELVERLPGLVEFGAIAGPLLAPALRERQALAATRARIEDVIAHRRFHTVFQPIVALAERVVVGHEALTRFDDGRSPDLVFADADRAGLGLALEAATLRAAFEAAGPLPANAFLDLNVSPELVLAGEPLRSMLAEFGFGAVLEITEHRPVPDYAAFREAIAALGGAHLAVDDAGAGFASLRHIVELRPALIKLDRMLVGGVDGDPARAAAVAGMVSLAERLGATLVAEGVETERERSALLGAGVRYGQGFLLGRPARPAATRSDAA